MNQNFKISVKGILQNKHQLLRFNERDEWELIGGKLEETDQSLGERLEIEFVEETGIPVTVEGPLEPWIYTIGYRYILITPFFCDGDFENSKIVPEGNARFEWFQHTEIDDLPMPNGYKDSINSVIPRSSHSEAINDPNAIVKGFKVNIACVYFKDGLYGNLDGKKVAMSRLVYTETPRSIAKEIARSYQIDDSSLTFHNTMILSDEIWVFYVLETPDDRKFDWLKRTDLLLQCENLTQ